MLVLEALGKVYPNGVHALERFSATVKLGEIVAVIGGSGCGKSTLLRAIAGLDPATSGAVTLDGIEHQHQAVPLCVPNASCQRNNGAEAISISQSVVLPRMAKMTMAARICAGLPSCCPSIRR